VSVSQHHIGQQVPPRAELLGAFFPSRRRVLAGFMGEWPDLKAALAGFDFHAAVGDRTDGGSWM
jgi:hypothetical protein